MAASDRDMPLSTTRLYAAAIAIVSGLYSIGSPIWGMSPDRMGLSGWIMLVVGIAVLVHGVALLTPAGGRLGRLSGPLMIVWAVIMLANQWIAAMESGGMMMTAGPDPGMIAIAVLMLASGLIMVARPMAVQRTD